MKLRQLFEASYDSMIAKMKQDFPEHQQLIQDYLKMSKVIFKKDEKIVWWMKNVRQTLTDIKNNKLPASLEDLKAEFEEVTHYFGYNIATIDNYQFGNKTYVQVINDLDKLEKQHLEKQKQTAPVTPQPGDKELIKFNDGTAWWLLDRAYCSDEARSGGHCGNIVGQHKTDQRILSFRKDGHVLLTFILEPDGSLGEMKAKHNQKPSEKFHPYIMSLLLLDTVKGIQGAGYLPQNNFSIFDLDDKNLKIIQQKKPNLIADQLMAEPMEFMNAPKWIKQDTHYQMIAKQNLKGLDEILDDNGNITLDIKSWQKAVDLNKKMILYVPDNYPNLENELIVFLSRQPQMILQADNKITHNQTIMTRVVDKNDEAFAYILPNNPHFEQLAIRAIQQNGWNIQNIPEPNQTEKMAEVAVQQDGMTLEIIAERLLNPKLVIYAAKQQARALRFVKDHSLISMNTIKAAYQEHQFNVLEWIDPTHPDYENFAVYGINQHAGEYFDVEPENRTLAIAKAFVENYSSERYPSISNVSDQFKPKLYKTFLIHSNFPQSLAMIPEEARTLELCKLAVEKHQSNMKYVPEKLQPKLAMIPIETYFNDTHPNLDFDQLSTTDIRKQMIKDYLKFQDATPEQKKQAYNTLLDMEIDVLDLLKFIEKYKD